MTDSTNTAHGTGALHKALDLFLALAEGPDDADLATIARERGIATSTAYRLVQPFVDAGLIAKPKRGQFVPGLRLLKLSRASQVRDVVSQIARPHVQRLAKQLSLTVHCGVMEADMVTYLVKAGPRAADLFTREGMQLEAYCSGIGKVLLAHMTPAVQDAYLAIADFVPLTQKTKTNPEEMRAEWQAILRQKYGEDREEVMEGLNCIAVPVYNVKHEAVAALSASRRSTGALHGKAKERVLKALQHEANALGKKLNHLSAV